MFGFYINFVNITLYIKPLFIRILKNVYASDGKGNDVTLNIQDHHQTIEGLKLYKASVLDGGYLGHSNVMVK